MLNLVWCILNILTLVCLVIICLRVIKLVRNKLGLIVVLIFILSPLYFLKFKNNDLNIKIFHINTPNIKMNGSKNISVILDENFSSKINLSILYCKNSNETIPLRANSTIEGLVCGAKWIPSDIQIQNGSQNKIFKYEVYGKISWSLIGIEIYSQEKAYLGGINYI